MAIFVSPAAAAPMRGLDSVEALTGRGLAGDRYAGGSGFWRLTDACQVTLIAEEQLVRAAGRTGVSLLRGEHRRNLVVRDLPLERLLGRRLSVGTALLLCDKLRPPCGYLESITEPGMAKALAKGCGGVCAQVLLGGVLRVGDRVAVVKQDAVGGALDR